MSKKSKPTKVRAELADKTNEDPALKRTLYKKLAIATLLGFGISIVFSIATVITPHTDNARLTYEFIASIGWFIGLPAAFVLILKRRNLFAVGKYAGLQLNERDTKERQEVFVKSYYYAFNLVVLTALAYILFDNTAWIIQQAGPSAKGSLPNAYFTPLIDVAFLLLAMPSIVGSLRKR